MRNLYLGVLLAPYRLDYYNYIYKHMNCDIYFQLRGFEGQLFSTEDLEAKCDFTPKYLNITRIMGDRQLVWGLHNIIKKANPQFIMVPEFSFLTMQVILIKKLFGYKFQIISQCDDSYAMLVGNGFSRFHAWSRKICMPYLSNLVLLDSRAKEWYQSHYGKGIFMPLLTDDSKYCITENIKKKAEAYKSKYNLNNCKTLLFVGRLVNVKNLPRLFKACSLLKFNYKLIIVGEGVLMEEWKEKANQLNINVEFVGRKNGDDLTAWYYSADVFVLPSIMEAFGAVTNEALLGGCNCVISKVAGSACLIEECKNGYLIDPNSENDIAEKITLASKLRLNKGRASKMPMTFMDAMKSMEAEFQVKVLRVFHVVTHLEIGGAERVAINIAKSQAKDIEYHIVEVVRSNSEFADKLVNELVSSGIYVHRSPIHNNKLGILFFWIWFTGLYLKFKPNVIHAHTEIPDLALWLFRKISWLFFWVSCKYVRTIHNTELWNEWKGIGHVVERYYIKHHCNVAISQSTKESYEKKYGDNDVPLIYNGVEEVPQIKFPYLKSDVVNILFAGRLEHQKGIDQLIDVISGLKNDGRYHFHIVGNGSYSAKIAQTIGKFENVSTYDKIYGLSQYLGSFDYLFMPSNHEGLPLMCVEASLAHTPTIINRCAGLDETLPKDWPLAVDDNSVSAFIDIFQNKMNKEEYQHLAETAYHFAKEKFSIDKMQQEYENMYRM